jgi:hypothetical protein
MANCGRSGDRIGKDAAPAIEVKNWRRCMMVSRGLVVDIVAARATRRKGVSTWPRWKIGVETHAARV